MACSSVTQPPVWYFEGLILKLVTSLIGKCNIYWVIFTEQRLSSQLCLLVQISRLSGRRWRVAVWKPRRSDVEVNSAAALGCHREYEYLTVQKKKKWHRRQIHQSIQAECVSVCACACVDSHHTVLLQKYTPSNRNQCTAHISACVFFCSLLCFLWFMHVLFT